MRTLPQPKSVILGIAFTLVTTAALAFGVGRPAAAQTVITGVKTEPVAAIRLGAYFPFNHAVQNGVGKTFVGGGLDYSIEHKPGISRTILSLDYIERSSGGHTIRVVPATLGVFSYQGVSDKIRPFVGGGIGAYFIHTNVLDNLGNLETKDGTAFGGYIAAGFDFGQSTFAELRYHTMTRVGSAKPDGLQMTIGFRF